jgi:hypothetical protein
MYSVRLEMSHTHHRHHHYSSCRFRGEVVRTLQVISSSPIRAVVHVCRSRGMMSPHQVSLPRKAWVSDRVVVTVNRLFRVTVQCTSFAT